MNETARLSPNFEIAIPKAIREAHAWRVGQEFAILPSEDGILLVPVPERDTLRGVAGGADTSAYRDRADRV